MESYFNSLKIFSDSYNYINDNGEILKKIKNLSKINIFVGENNSGKSRFIRTILINNLEYTLFSEDEPYIEIKNQIDQFLINIQDISDYKHIINPRDYNFEWHINSECYNLEISNKFKSTIDGIENKIHQGKSNTGYIRNRSNTIASIAEKIEPHFCEFKENLLNLGYLSIIESDFKKLYIPILRSLFSLTNVDIEEYDLYENKIINYYFPNFVKQKDIEIFTGLKAYKYIKNYLLGDLDQRALVANYQEFLSKNFFDNKPVVLIPKENDLELTIKIGDEEEKPIYELGDGIQSIIIFTMPLFLNDNDNLLVFVEEPEKLIHPGLQRKLIECILKDELLSKYQYFFTTHSNHFLDITLDFDKISIFKVKKLLDDSDSKRKIPTFRIENLSPGDKSALEVLGVRNSSVFLSNCTIWVEGITDRKYFKHYLDLYMDYLGKDKKFREDYHYSFVEYGGNNITHWSFLDEEDEGDENNELVNVERLCSRLFLISDRDEGKEERHLKLEKCLQDRYYCLNCLEVENLITKKLLEKVLVEGYGEPEENLDFEFPDDELKNRYLGELIDDKIIIDVNKRKRRTNYGEESGTIKSKSPFCEKALKHINSYDDLSDEAKQIAEKLYNFIKDNNSEIIN